MTYDDLIDDFRSRIGDLLAVGTLGINPLPTPTDGSVGRAKLLRAYGEEILKLGVELEKLRSALKHIDESTDRNSADIAILTKAFSMTREDSTT